MPLSPLVPALLLLPLSSLHADEPALPAAQELLELLASYAYLEQVDASDAEEVSRHLVPLGAMSKIRGVWAPRQSERMDGELWRFTWRVNDGFLSSEVVTSLDDSLSNNPAAVLRFSCEARACGSSAQWANRIFGERLLYGTEASQRYRVYTIDEAKGKADSEAAQIDNRLLIYASSRGASRQYLHLEFLVGSIAGS